MSFSRVHFQIRDNVRDNSKRSIIGPLQDPVTWYGINYAGAQTTQWDFQNTGTRTSPARLSFVLKVPLRYLRPSTIYSLPCNWIGPITISYVSESLTWPPCVY